MRYSMRKIALLAAALMIMAVPVLAEDGPLRPGMEPEGLKDKECILVAMNCDVDRFDSIRQSVDRIQSEINRGSGVYTSDELKRLQERLDEATRTLNDSTSGGA